jgi:hypothetical protein
MAVSSSGQLRLRADIALEVDGSATGDNVSLGTLSNEAGFTEPDTMSEFYGYSAFTAPTMSGNIGTASVTETSMNAAAPAVYNTGAALIERGFYFGTSTTATNNTFYSSGTTTQSGVNFSRSFTGLSGGTTYYIWGVVRDTQSPARFTELLTPMKTQATLPTVSYTITNASGSFHEHYTGGGSPSISNNMNCRYQHVYYGWTTTMNYTFTTNTAWAYSSINLGQKAGWQTGQGTLNRGNYSVTASGEIAYPGMQIDTASPFSSGPYYVSASCSNTLGNSSISITGSGNVYGSMTSTQCGGNWECYTNGASSSFSGGGYTSRVC